MRGDERVGTGRRIGYARVSTADQNPQLQCDALTSHGCDHIFVDEDASGSNRHRPALQQALDTAQEGDVIIVWKLDRLARSLQDLLDITNELKSRGIGFESLTEKIDTSSAFGEFAFHIIAAVAHMERRIIVERTIAGLDAARRRGKRLGRTPKLSPETITSAFREWRNGEDHESIAARYGVAPVTLMRAFARLDEPEAAI